MFCGGRQRGRNSSKAARVRVKLHNKSPAIEAEVLCYWALGPIA